MARAHQPGQAGFKPILPEDIAWKPFQAFPPAIGPLGLDYLDPDDDPRTRAAS